MLTCATGCFNTRVSLGALGLHQGPYARWGLQEGPVGEGEPAAPSKR